MKIMFRLSHNKEIPVYLTVEKASPIQGEAFSIILTNGFPKSVNQHIK